MRNPLAGFATWRGKKCTQRRKGNKEKLKRI